VATVVLGTASGADDVVQDASLRAWRAIASLDPARPFRPWFLRVVANAARNDRRSRSRRASLVLRNSGARPLAAPGPEERSVSLAEQRAVIEALNRLGRDDRLWIALRHIEQLDEAQMADVLGCPVGTVKSRLSRAMARLRDEMRTLDDA